MSTAKDALLRNEAVKSQIAVEITLQDNSVFYWGTADFVLDFINNNGDKAEFNQTIISKLRQVPEIRFALTTVLDGGRFTFENLDYAISQTLGSEGYAYARAKVRIFYCMLLANAWYGELIFVGKLRDANANSTVAEFGVVSDLADVKALVANRQLTQKCLAVLGDDRCGLAGIGPGDVCTKVFDDPVGGCLFWGNQARFWGVPFITAEQLGIGTTGGGSGWIEPGGGGRHCCDPSHFVKTPTGYAVLGELQPGDAIIDHLGQITLVTKTERPLAPRRYFLKTANGLQIVCSPSHPVYLRIKVNEGWQEKGEMSVLNLGKYPDGEILTHNGRHVEWATFQIGISNPGPVIALSLEHERLYLVNSVPEQGGIVSHNKDGIFWEASL